MGTKLLVVLLLLNFHCMPSTYAAQVKQKLPQNSSVRQTPKRVSKSNPNVGWQNNIIQVHAGRQIAFLLQGQQYVGLDRVRAIRYRPTSASQRRKGLSSQPSRDIQPRLGQLTRQGQWIDVVVNKNAPTGAYWLEGLRPKSNLALVAFPVVIEVIPPNKRPRRPANQPRVPKNSIRVVAHKLSNGQPPITSAAAPRVSARNSAVSQSRNRAKVPQRARSQRAPRQRASTALIATVPLSGQAMQAYDPKCELNSDLMQLIIEGGGSMPCAGNVSTSGPSNATYLLSHAPMSVGEVGAQLDIFASNLANPQNVYVSLAGQQLSIISASVSKLEVRLPNEAVTGALIVARSNGEVLGNLDNAYQVIVPPSPITELFADFTGMQSTASWKLGYQMSLLSWLAYFDDLGGYLADNETFAHQLGVQVRSDFDVTQYGFDVCHNASGSMQGVVFEHSNSDTVIISIRGSQTGNAAQDWWDNDLDPQPFARFGWALGSSIHCGFHQAAKVVYDELIGDLKDDAAAGKKIWVTGHSLGGASAMLLAAMLEWDADIAVSGVYTYGAPGVGNFVFGNAYNDAIPNTHRFELQRDPAVSLFYPVHGRPGSNHLLHTDGNTGLNASQGYLAYLGLTPISDLMVTHMEYWCRVYAEMDEAVSQNLTDTLVVPPGNPDGSGVCEVSDFYGSLP